MEHDRQIENRDGVLKVYILFYPVFQHTVL